MQFISLNIDHDDQRLIIELSRILNFYNIKKKLFEVIINNVNNNIIMKTELNKAMTRRDFSKNKTQYAFFYIIYIFNLITQDFIINLNSKVSKNFVVKLKNAQINNVVKSQNLFLIIKKVRFATNNAYK